MAAHDCQGRSRPDAAARRTGCLQQGQCAQVLVPVRVQQLPPERVLVLLRQAALPHSRGSHRVLAPRPQVAEHGLGYSAGSM